MAQTSVIGGSLTVKANGERLRLLRERLNLKQSKVEKGAGLPANRLTQYERSMPISIAHLRKLSTYYNVPARELAEEASLQTLAGVVSMAASVLEWQIDFNGSTPAQAEEEESGPGPQG